MTAKVAWSLNLPNRLGFDRFLVNSIRYDARNVISLTPFYPCRYSVSSPVLNDNIQC